MREDYAAQETFEAPAGKSRLLSRLYRDIGLAAVAIELDLLAETLDIELEDAIERGARYIAPIPLALAS